MENNKQFLIRDSLGNVFNKVNDPAVIVDNNILIKIGEYNDMLEYLEVMKEKYYKGGYIEFADNLSVIKVPKNQQEIDKIFNNSNYIDKYIPIK